MIENIVHLFLSWDFYQLLATAAIPFALHRYAKTTTTMNAINELRSKSAVIWGDISVLSKDFDGLSEIERHKIMNYLNEYDHFCTLFNEGLVSKDLVKRTRKTTVVNAYNIHKDFIQRWREEYDTGAWRNLQLCAERLQKL